MGEKINCSESEKNTVKIIKRIEFAAPGITGMVEITIDPSMGAYHPNWTFAFNIRDIMIIAEGLKSNPYTCFFSDNKTTI